MTSDSHDPSDTEENTDLKNPLDLEVKIAKKIKTTNKPHEHPAGTFFRLHFDTTGPEVKLDSVMDSHNGKDFVIIPKAPKMDNITDASNRHLITCSYPCHVAKKKAPGEDISSKDADNSDSHYWINFAILPNEGYYFFSFTMTHDPLFQKNVTQEVTIGILSHGGAGGGGVSK